MDRDLVASANDIEPVPFFTCWEIRVGGGVPAGDFLIGAIELENVEKWVVLVMLV